MRVKAFQQVSKEVWWTPTPGKRLGLRSELGPVQVDTAQVGTRLSGVALRPSPDKILSLLQLAAKDLDFSSFVLANS